MVNDTKTNAPKEERKDDKMNVDETTKKNDKKDPQEEELVSTSWYDLRRC